MAEQHRGHLLQSNQPIVFPDGTMQYFFRDYLNRAEREFTDHIDPAIIANPHTQYMRWLGTWSAGEYSANSVVVNGLLTMVANKTTSNTPTEGDPDWDLLAKSTP